MRILMGSPLTFCLVLLMSFGSVYTPAAAAQTGVQNSSGNSPVGLWKTVDDATGKVRIAYRPVHQHPMTNDIASIPPGAREY